MLIRMAIIKEEITRIDQDLEKKERLCTVGGSVNWCSHYRNLCTGSSKIKTRTPTWSSSPSFGYITKRGSENRLKEISGLLGCCSFIHNSPVIRKTQLFINGWTGKRNHMWYVTYIQWTVLSLKIDGNPGIWGMSEPGGCYAKWKKLVTEGQVLHTWSQW